MIYAVVEGEVYKVDCLLFFARIYHHLERKKDLENSKNVVKLTELHQQLQNHEQHLRQEEVGGETRVNSVHKETENE
jgi:hypothetical protein